LDCYLTTSEPSQPEVLSLKMITFIDKSFTAGSNTLYYKNFRFHDHLIESPGAIKAYWLNTKSSNMVL